MSWPNDPKCPAPLREFLDGAADQGQFGPDEDDPYA